MLHRDHCNTLINNLHHAFSEPSKQSKRPKQLLTRQDLDSRSLGHHAGYQTSTTTQASVLHQCYDMGSLLSCFFFRFLRVSEFTIPAQDQYDQSCHLSFNDVSLDIRDNPHGKGLHQTIKNEPISQGC